MDAFQGAPLEVIQLGREVGDLSFHSTWDIIEAVEKGFLAVDE